LETFNFKYALLKDAIKLTVVDGLVSKFSEEQIGNIYHQFKNKMI